MTLAPLVVDTLRAQPGIDPGRLRFTISGDGIVTLEGIVHTYADKCMAEEALLRVPDICGVRNLLEVRLTVGDYRTDATLERVLRELIDSLARMPADRPRMSVNQGWVTLEGTVAHPFQKQLVANAVREVAGVVGITNQIAIEKERRTERPPLACATS